MKIGLVVDNKKKKARKMLAKNKPAEKKSWFGLPSYNKSINKRKKEIDDIADYG